MWNVSKNLLAWKACDNRGHRKFVSESWSYKTARTDEKQTFFDHGAPQGVCDTLSNAFMLLANQQKDGDSPVKMLVQGLQARSSMRR